MDRVLVFTRTKHGADRVVKKLAQSDIPANAIHGNKSQPQRERALEEFKAGRAKILVATDIAARGIDVTGISHVVNFELPNVAEQYVHRIGRTARAGREGVALSFCAQDERDYLRDIQKLTKRHARPGAAARRACARKSRSSPSMSSRSAARAAIRAATAAASRRGATPAPKRSATRAAKPASSRAASRASVAGQGSARAPGGKPGGNFKSGGGNGNGGNRGRGRGRPGGGAAGRAGLIGSSTHSKGRPASGRPLLASVPSCAGIGSSSRSAAARSSRARGGSAIATPWLRRNGPTASCRARSRRSQAGDHRGDPPDDLARRPQLPATENPLSAWTQPAPASTSSASIAGRPGL